MYFQKPSLRFEPTYQLWPRLEFPIRHVKLLLTDILDKHYSRFDKYECKKFMKDSEAVSQTIRNRIKSMNADRYRIVCIITAGEKFFQDIDYRTGFLWDQERDKWATCVYENQHFYVCATVFGIYFD